MTGTRPQDFSREHALIDTSMGSSSVLPSLGKIVSTLEKMWAEPFIIGDIAGVAVYIDRPSRTLYYLDDGKRIPLGSVDHPFLHNTKLQAAARRALNEHSPVA